MSAPHAGKPEITEYAVVLAVTLGADCPHKLARTFGVGALNGDLVRVVNQLATDRIICAGEAHHTRSGIRCKAIDFPVPMREMRREMGLPVQWSDTLDT